MSVNHRDLVQAAPQLLPAMDSEDYFQLVSSYWTQAEWNKEQADLTKIDEALGHLVHFADHAPHAMLKRFSSEVVRDDWSIYGCFWHGLVSFRHYDYEKAKYWFKYVTVSDQIPIPGGLQSKSFIASSYFQLKASISAGSNNRHIVVLVHAWYRLGICGYRLRFNGDAEQAFSSVEAYLTHFTFTQACPVIKQLEYKWQCAFNYLLLSNFQAALPYMDALRAAKQSNAASLDAYAALLLGDVEKTTALLELNPLNDDATRLCRINIALAADDPAPALELLERYLIIVPDSSSLRVIRNQLLFKLGREVEAIADCERIVDNSSDSYDILMNLAALKEFNALRYRHGAAELAAASDNVDNLKTTAGVMIYLAKCQRDPQLHTRPRLLYALAWAQSQWQPTAMAGTLRVLFQKFTLTSIGPSHRENLVNLMMQAECQPWFNKEKRIEVNNPRLREELIAFIKQQKHDGQRLLAVKNNLGLQMCCYGTFPNSFFSRKGPKELNYYDGPHKLIADILNTQLATFPAMMASTRMGVKIEAANSQFLYIMRHRFSGVYNAIYTEALNEELLLIAAERNAEYEIIFGDDERATEFLKDWYNRHPQTMNAHILRAKALARLPGQPFRGHGHYDPLCSLQGALRISVPDTLSAIDQLIAKMSVPDTIVHPLLELAEGAFFTCHGQAFLEQKRYSEAYCDFSLVIMQYPDGCWVDAHVCRAMAAVHLKQWEQAVADLTVVVTRPSHRRDIARKQVRDAWENLLTENVEFNAYLKHNHHDVFGKWLKWTKGFTTYTAVAASPDNYIQSSMAHVYVSPDNETAEDLVTRGQISMRENKFQIAIQYYIQAINKAIQQPAAALPWLAQVENDFSKMKGVERERQQAQARVLLLTAKTKHLLSDSAKAETAVRNAYQLSPTDPDIIKEYLEILFAGAHFNDVYVAAMQVIAAPSNSRQEDNDKIQDLARLYVCKVYAKKGEYSKAIDILSSMVVKRCGVGVDELIKDVFYPTLITIEHITAAIIRDPKNANLYYLCGMIKGGNKQYVEAIKDFSMVEQLDPQVAKKMYYWRGAAYLNVISLGFPEAEDFQRAARFTPELIVLEKRFNDNVYIPSVGLKRLIEAHYRFTDNQAELVARRDQLVQALRAYQMQMLTVNSAAIAVAASPRAPNLAEHPLTTEFLHTVRDFEAYVKSIHYGASSIVIIALAYAVADDYPAAQQACNTLFCQSIPAFIDEAYYHEFLEMVVAPECYCWSPQKTELHKHRDINQLQRSVQTILTEPRKDNATYQIALFNASLQALCPETLLGAVYYLPGFYSQPSLAHGYLREIATFLNTGMQTMTASQISRNTQAALCNAAINYPGWKDELKKYPDLYQIIAPMLAMSEQAAPKLKKFPVMNTQPVSTHITQFRAKPGALEAASVAGSVDYDRGLDL